MTDDKPLTTTIQGDELKNCCPEPPKPHIKLEIVPPESYTEEQKTLAHEVITGAAEGALEAVINLIENNIGGVLVLYLPDPAWSQPHQEIARAMVNEATQEGIRRVEKVMDALYGKPAFGGSYADHGKVTHAEGNDVLN